SPIGATNNRSPIRNPIPAQVFTASCCEGSPAANPRQRASISRSRWNGVGTSDMLPLPFVRFAGLPGLARKHGVEGLQQCRFVHGLGQVILGTLALSPNLIGFLILGGHNDHRNVT